ncbi:MAG: hypothetical protein A4E38_01619 [Methanoregulaceae archaeon PtaB.Bin108]|nr:MAG: hypothetical protein A4E38_01619 [Methanoregulaceae archaeon PtaB.Bin108]
MRIIGTLMRSWKREIPSVVLLWGLSTSPRSWKTRRVMVVLVWQTRKPRKIAEGRGKPIQYARAAATRTVTPTWMAPPRRTIFFIWKSVRKENCIPIEKSRKITPISDKNWMISWSWMSPRPYGPASMPVMINPTIPGTRNFCPRNMTRTERPRTIRIFRRKASTSIMLSVECYPVYSAGEVMRLPVGGVPDISQRINTAYVVIETQLR